MTSSPAAPNSSKGPRYAPPDLSLPQPWRALIDGNTGNVYFWNPKTRVTQYQRPFAEPVSESQPPLFSPKPVCVLLSKEDKVGQSNAASSSVQPSRNDTSKDDGIGSGHQNAPSSSMEHSSECTSKEDDIGLHNAPSSSAQPSSECIFKDDDIGWKIGPGSSGEPSNEHALKHDETAHSDAPSFSEKPLSKHAPKQDDTGHSDVPSSSMQPSSKRSYKEDYNVSSATDSSKRPRYVSEDPSLPKPWRALIDGNTGNIYFWNPKTKVTQYQRPVDESLSAQAAVLPTTMEALFVPVRVHHPSSEHVSKEETICQSNASWRYQDQDYRVCNTILLDSSTKTSQESSVSEYNVPNQSSYRVAATADAYRRQHEISVSADDVPAPYMTFQSTGFPTEILREVHHAGFTSPTPIQAQSWPIALKGCDIVAIAKTGSGKTLGYLIPGFILLKRLHNDSKLGPTVLVLSPTRELATQIHDEAIKFGKSSRISCTCLYGGAPKGPQLRELGCGVDIVVATPGRLNDIIDMKRVNLCQVSYLVLDEADRMLDMGFEPQIRKIVDHLPPRRQTLMFTATWPRAVRRIAADLLDNPVQVNIGSTDSLVANKSITQHVEVITPMDKHRRLEQILRSQAPGSKIIVFCSTKRMCDQLARNLTSQFGAAAIHGDKSQSERDSVLSQFRSGRAPVLVATDVAARGLDIKDIRVVINYDFPMGVEDYVHRIGRTGRAGATGVAYTFFCDQDSKYAADLVKILEGASQHVPFELQQMVSHGRYGGMCRRW